MYITMMSMGKYILLLSCVVSSVYSCHLGWKAFGNSCYHFSHDSENWISAVEVCKVLYDAYLVEINTHEESLFLESQAKLYNRTFWIGLSDLERDSNWVWVGSKQTLASTGFSDWAPGEPNNYVGGEEGCAVIYKDLKSRWADAPCNWNVPHYICEKKSASISPVG